MSKKNNLFTCSHNHPGMCAMGNAKCSPDCTWYGKCEKCLDFHIPAGQEPCCECANLRIDLRPSENGRFLLCRKEV